MTDLGESERWLHVLARFAVKEAVFKAIDPLLARNDITHQSIVVRPKSGFRPGMTADMAVSLRLSGAGGLLLITAGCSLADRRLVATALARHL
jgi:phosphopantetheinyl transferase (holo-ACP synthase)